MYPWHPFTVHFPIALLIVHGIGVWLYLRRGERAYEISAYYALILGWVGSLIATLTGAIDAARQLVGPDVPRDAALLAWVNAHAIGGVAIVLIYGRALLRRRRNPTILDDPDARGGYLRLIMIGIIFTLASGWLGGHLVYTLRLGIAS